MVNKIIRNYIAKMVAGRADDGIMITLKDPQKVEFQTAMMQDLLMRRGIDPNAIQSEAQLKMIINQIKAMEKAEDAAQAGIRNTESAKIFNRMGEELDPNQPIIGGTQPGKSIDTDTFVRLAETNTQRMKQRISDKKIESDKPPPGSRGGPDDIAAPVQSAEDSLRDMNLDELADISADIKANIEAQNKKSIENILKRKNREDVYGLEDYDTTNMSEIKKEIIRTETKLGNLNPDDPNFRAKAKPLVDKITALQKKLREDKAYGGRIGYSIGDRVIPDNDFMNLSLGNMTQGQNTQTAGLLDTLNPFSKSDEEKALEQIQDLREQENQIKSLGEGAIELKKDELQNIEQQIQDLKQQYPDDEGIQQAFDPYADIQGQTAFLDPVTVIGGLINVGKGAKASALAKEFFKQKAKEKIGKEIYDKIQKKIKTPKYPTTPPPTTGGGGADSGGYTPTTTAQNVSRTSSRVDSSGNVKAYGLRDGGRIGFFLGSKLPKGLATLRTMLNYMGKKSDVVKKPSDVLKMVNPKSLNKMLEDPNLLFMKGSKKEGIMASDMVKNFQSKMGEDRVQVVRDMLDAAKNIKRSDDKILKYKNEIKERMMKDLNMSEAAADTAATAMSRLAMNITKMPDTPKLTDEGILQLENVLKNMETGGKKKRDLNADGGRIGLKDGMNRRTFLKLLGGAMSIPIIGKIFKPLKVGKTVTKVPIIKTDNVVGKPEWFDQLVNKVILEGDEVTKRFATKDREIVHMKKIDDDNTVMVYQDLDEGAVRVDYDAPSNMGEDTVSLQYKKPKPDEGDPRPKAEFEATELEPRYVGGPEDADIEFDGLGGGSSIKMLESDVSKLKEYATGQKQTLKEFIESKKRKDAVKRINEDTMEQAEYIAGKYGDGPEPPDDIDFASGGIARMLGE